MSLQPYQPAEVAAYQAPAQVTDYQSRAVARLGEWAVAADAAYTVAQRLVQSSFVPVAFRGKPVEATAAILAGSEVGLSPMAALRAFDVIQGQAAPRALTLRAIAQSYGHDIEVIEATNTRCRVRARRRGGDWQSVLWTIDRAKELGLTGKDNWRKQPGAMLVARATSEAARLVAADAILGIGYSAEEIADGGTVEQSVAVETVTATPTGTRRMSRATMPVAEMVEAETVAHVEPDPGPLGDPDAPTLRTEAQSRALHAALRKAGVTTGDPGDRALALAYCSQAIGREVASTKDLTRAEAALVIDMLNADAADTATLPGVS